MQKSLLPNKRTNIMELQIKLSMFLITLPIVFATAALHLTAGQNWMGAAQRSIKENGLKASHHSKWCLSLWVDADEALHLAANSQTVQNLSLNIHDSEVCQSFLDHSCAQPCL